MKAEPTKAYATLGFEGDCLDPRQITKFFGVEPTKACGKGESYYGGPKSSDLRATMGIWFLCTDEKVSGNNLEDHLQYLIHKLKIDPKLSDFEYNVQRIKKLTQDLELTASVSCFWYGHFGDKEPTIPARFVAGFKRINVSIEKNFDTYEVPIDGHVLGG